MYSLQYNKQTDLYIYHNLNSGVVFTREYENIGGEKKIMCDAIKNLQSIDKIITFSRFITKENNTITEEFGNFIVSFGVHHFINPQNKEIIQKLKEKKKLEINNFETNYLNYYPVNGELDKYLKFQKQILEKQQSNPQTVQIICKSIYNENLDLPKKN